MNVHDHKESRSEARLLKFDSRCWTMWLASICLVICAGCGYPQVSPKAYEISKALYTVCNLKRQDDLDKVADAISTAESASELNEGESGWLIEIVEQARSGEWEAAELESRLILEDQVDL